MNPWRTACIRHNLSKMREDWPAQLGLPREPGLAERLDGLGDDARAAHPDLHLDDVAFVRYVAERLAPDEAVLPQLDALVIPDMYLALGCLEGAPVALATFERRYVSSLASLCRTFRHLPVEASDVQQLVREKLLVRVGDNPPKLALYRGEGELGAWLRVVVTRLLLNLSKRQHRESPEQVFDSLIAQDDGAESVLLRRATAEDMKAIFAEALATLSVRDRNMLRYQYVDALTAGEVAKIYRVHRATVMRWQSEIRTTLRQAMIDACARRLKLSQDQLDSLARGALTGFEMTLSRYLALPTG